MSLPKRPQRKNTLGIDYEFIVDQYNHEHAVAKRAVETLRAFIEANDKGSSMEWVNRMVACDREARKAIGEIESSGWTP